MSNKRKLSNEASKKAGPIARVGLRGWARNNRDGLMVTIIGGVVVGLILATIIPGPKPAPTHAQNETQINVTGSKFVNNGIGISVPKGVSVAASGSEFVGNGIATEVRDASTATVDAEKR